MTDTAEYWNDVHRPVIYGRNPPPHDCVPRGGPAGTPFRHSCKVCGKRFKHLPDEPR